jgi:hypothetical protein
MEELFFSATYFPAFPHFVLASRMKHTIHHASAEIFHYTTIGCQYAYRLEKSDLQKYQDEHCRYTLCKGNPRSHKHRCSTEKCESTAENISGLVL